MTTVTWTLILLFWDTGAAVCVPQFQDKMACEMASVVNVSRVGQGSEQPYRFCVETPNALLVRCN